MSRPAWGMRLVAGLALVCGLGCGLACAAAAQESCGAGQDLVVQALEHMRADSTADQLVDADEYLKRASELCSELGPAWYYRSLVEARLGHAAVAAYAMRQAQMFPSNALRQGLNPFVLAAPRRGPAPGPIQQKWALVVGLSHFHDATIPSLEFGVQDAQSFYGTLVNAKYGKFPADHVRLLIESQATTEGIREGLNWLARMASPDDLVVVYVVTHGSERTLDTAGANYIITYDTELGAEQNPDTLYATAYPIVDLANAIATRVKARRAAIFLDTCYSGAAAADSAHELKPASISAETLARATQGTGRVVMAASKTDQPSLESTQLAHGYFTYYLVQALQQLGGGAPVDTVYRYVQKHVSEQVASDWRAYGNQYAQDPVMSRSSESTDFPLDSAPASSRAADAIPAAARASLPGVASTLP